MIENERLRELWSRDGSAACACEFYSADATPTSEGFDPVDALACFASTEFTFRGRTYSRIVNRFGQIKRTISGEINTTNVTLNNLDRAVAQFEFQYGFEGLIMVVRLLDLEESVALSDTQLLFVGRCEKPESGTKNEITVPAKFVLGSLDVRLPRRKFGPDDPEGRTSDNDEFEGFVHMPVTGQNNYNRIEKRGGFLGWWNKKEVRVTEQWSSYANYDANKSLPVCVGQVQMLGVTMAAADVGPQIRMQKAFCEGPIQDFINVRSTDPNLPLNAPTMVPGGGSYWETYGLVGSANDLDPTNFGWDTWPGEPNPATGGRFYYSRTARIACQADNSALDVSDPEPDVAAVVQGLLMYTPDASGNWSVFQWTDNAAAFVYYLLTDSTYYRLHANWIDTAYFTEAYRYNDELIFNTSVDDFIFVEEG